MTLPRLYRSLTRPLGLPVRVLLRRRARRGKEDALRLGERLGQPSLPRPEGPLVWTHAASVGEATSVLALIERILRDRPELEILITTGTVASARLLEGRLPARARHQFAPVDLPSAIDRFLDHWRPDLALWVESELWPNLILATGARHVPIVLVNGRLSARSYRRWLYLPGLIRPILTGFALCLVQDDEQAARFSALGAPDVTTVGDLKAGAEALPVNGPELARLRERIGGRPLWLAASTHAGEEEVAAEAHACLAPRHPGLLTIVAPRHPARGAAIARMLAARGLRVARRAGGEPIAAETDVYLADTIGELGLFYRLAGIAFVGKSLIGRGGHNPFEPARLGCAVLHGPEMSNVAGMAAALDACGASERVTGPGELATAVSRLLGDRALRATRAAAGARAAAAGLGVLDEVLRRLAPYLDPLAAAAPEAPRQHPPLRA